jgi:phage baseplate assembly protein W
MSARYSGWRYRVPTSDAPDERAGLDTTPTGAIDTVTDDEAIRQALQLLISTRPGERVMRPEYGCYLHRLIFSRNDDITAGLAMHYVRQAVERWEPRVQILRVDAAPAPENPTLLEVVLEYRVHATLRSGRLVTAVELYDQTAT